MQSMASILHAPVCWAAKLKSAESGSVCATCTSVKMSTDSSLLIIHKLCRIYPVTITATIVSWSF